MMFPPGSYWPTLKRGSVRWWWLRLFVRTQVVYEDGMRFEYKIARNGVVHLWNVGRA